MKQYIKKYVGIVFCLVCFILVGTLVYRHFIQVQNIFDQMYYCRVQTGFSKYFKTSSFDKMPQLEGSKQWGRTIPYEGVFQNNYKNNYLSENEFLEIDCSSREKVMTIFATKEFDEFKIIYKYNYDVKKKQLTESVGCRYGELYSGESTAYVEDFKEYTENIEEILLVIDKAGLTREDLIQYRNHFIYDKLLTDWLDVSNSRFSADRWGNVEVIEVLP